MFRFSHFLVFSALLLAPTTPAQQPDATPSSQSPLEAEVRLLDTSNVRTVILQDKIEILTKYGKLMVPTREIVKIDFGVRLTPEMQSQVTRSIENLNSENYKSREMAVKELVELGPYAYPQVCAAVKSDNPEVAKRAAMALERIKAKYPAANLRLRDYDIITTTTFPIFGIVSPATLRVRNDTFGDVDLKLAQVRAIRWIASAAPEMEVMVDAAKFGSAVSQWMETDFEVRSNHRLVIFASGSIELWPQGGGYACSPRGYNANGPSPTGTQFRSGSLLGRVGADGPIFMIGDFYDAPAGRDGKLFLHIVPSPWNNPSTGTYQVKIKARDDFGDDR